MPFHKIFFYLFLLVLPFQLGRHFWPDWSYVWGLRVDYLSPTIYLSDILVGLTLIAWTISCGWSNLSNWAHWRKKIKKQFSSTFFYFFLLFSTFFFLNFLNSSFPLLWLYKLVKLVELVLLGIYVVKNNSNPKGWRTIISLLLIGAVFQSGLAIAQFIKQSSVGGIFWWLGERTFNITTPGIATIALKNPFTGSQTLFLRPYGTFSHPNSLAGYLLVILVISSSRLFRFFYSLKFVLYSFLLVSFLLTFSRSAWLAGLLLLVLSNLYNLRALEKGKKGKKGLILLSLLILYTIYYILYTSTDPQGLQKRWQLILSSWEMIKSSPIFGIGIGHFIPKLAELPQKGQIFWLQPVHNIFLLVTAETGLIGLGIFLGVLAATYKHLVYGIWYMVYGIKGKKKILKEYYILHTTYYILLSLTAVTLTGLADHYWLTLQQNQLLFALVLGLCWSKFLTLKNLYSNRTVIGAGNFGKNKSLFKPWN